MLIFQLRVYMGRERLVVLVMDMVMVDGVPLHTTATCEYFHCRPILYYSIDHQNGRT